MTKIKNLFQITFCLLMAACSSTAVKEGGYGPDVILGPKCLVEPPKKFTQDLCKGNDLKEGKKHGRWCCYDVEENLRMAAEFKDGKKQGRAELYSPSGNLETISYWNDGWLDGSQATFFADGRKELDFFLVKGLLDGKLTEYYPSGKIRSIGEYKAGQRNGSYREWDEAGCLRLEEKDDQGQTVYSKEYPACAK